MGVLIVATGAVAPWNSKVALPVMRGLEGYFTFDSDSARFGFNRAPGKSDALITGAPLSFASHGRFNGQLNFLTTKIAETANQTIIVVGKSANALDAGAAVTDQPVYVSNDYGTAVNSPYTGITATGVGLYHPSNDRLQGAAARDNGSGAGSSAAVSLTASPATSWAIRAVRSIDTGENVVLDLTAGLSAVGTNKNARVLNNKTFRIGGRAIGNSALIDISAVAIYSVALTDAEIQLIAGVMRKRMFRLGIAV
jgi:hypothetical protein